ncbi:MAG: hypothetical protein AB7I27_08360 [Bacteriovoracaceae bacterium]
MKLLLSLILFTLTLSAFAQRPDEAIQVAREHISTKFGISLEELSDENRYSVNWEYLINRGDNQRLWISLDEIRGYTECKVEIDSETLEIYYSNCLKFWPWEGVH